MFLATERLLWFHIVHRDILNFQTIIEKLIYTHLTVTPSRSKYHNYNVYHFDYKADSKNIKYRSYQL